MDAHHSPYATTSSTRKPGDAGLSLGVALLWAPFGFFLAVLYGFWEVGPDCTWGGCSVGWPGSWGVVHGWRAVREAIALGWIGLALNAGLLALGVYFVLGIVLSGIAGGVL